MATGKRRSVVKTGIVAGIAVAGAIAVSAFPLAVDTQDATAQPEPTTAVERPLGNAPELPPLTCEESQRLDTAANDRSSRSGSAVPGPQQYPPVHPLFDPSAPPESPPIDPTTGKPKGLNAPELPQRPDYSGQAEALSRVGALSRPCGEVVDRILENSKVTGSIVCFLADGRYASEVMVDSTEDITPDEVCQYLGYDRSGR